MAEVMETPGGKWGEQIEAYKKAYKAWMVRADKVVKRYRDEKDNASEDPYAPDDAGGKYNVLYSNTSVLQPAVYSKTPQPVVSRRYADKDPIGRIASEILQRCLSTTIEEGFDPVMEAARDDYLMSSRATVWVRYEPVFGKEPLTMPTPQEDGTVIEVAVEDEDGKPIFPLESEYACADFIEYRDFAHTPVRKWDDVWWVGRRHYFDKEEATKTVGEKSAKMLDYVEHTTKAVPGQKSNEGNLDGQKKAEVWEIWDKKKKKVIFWSSHCKDEILKEVDAPFDFKDFFPCPKPCYGVMSNGTLIPVPFYCEYQDQAREMDNLTARMDNLLGACKVSGIYDTSVFPDMKALMQSFELEMTPVDNMAAKYAEKGSASSLDTVIKFFPVDIFAKVYDQLRMAREQLKRDIDEITGISDIVRGYSSPNATATAEQIKSNYATLRLDKMRNEVARFARDAIRLLAEIICEGFQPTTIIEMAGVEFMDDETKNGAMQAIEMLQNDKQRTFRIDIETDSTVAIDEGEEKQDRLEFLNTMAPFMEKGMMLVTQAPEMAPLVKESILFTIRSFKAGRQLESNFEQALDAMVKKAQQPQQPPPNPDMVKAEAQIKLEQQKAHASQQLEQQKAQNDIQLRTVEGTMDIQLQEKEAMAKILSNERIALAKISSEAKINMMRTANERQRPISSAN